MSSTYDITGVLPDELVSQVPAGSSVLISGPPMVGKRALAVRLLAAGHEADDGILCVTTSNNATSVLAEFERQFPTFDRNRLAIIDCSGSGVQETIDEIATERVASPSDLTGISIGTAKLLQRFSSRDVSDIRHGLVSISTLLQYLDLDTVFKFLHIYTARIDDTQGLGVFTVDSGAHDSQTINTLVSEFDSVIELRESTDGPREVRVKGFPETTPIWKPF